RDRAAETQLTAQTAGPDCHIAMYACGSVLCGTNAHHAECRLADSKQILFAPGWKSQLHRRRRVGVAIRSETNLRPNRDIAEAERFRARASLKQGRVAVRIDARAADGK